MRLCVLLQLIIRGKPEGRGSIGKGRTLWLGNVTQWMETRSYEHLMGQRRMCQADYQYQEDLKPYLRKAPKTDFIKNCQLY